MGHPCGGNGEPPLERNVRFFDGLEQSHIELAEREIGLSTRGMGQDSAVFLHDAGKKISEAAQGHGPVATPCDREQDMAASTSGGTFPLTASVQSRSKAMTRRYIIECKVEVQV